MKKGRISLDYLNDMLEAALYARQFVKDLSIEQFKTDLRTQFAVIRALEIIGEAGKKIPSQVKAQHPEIPWRLITGMRD